MAWAVVALLIALIPQHRNVSRNLKLLSLRAIGVAGSTVLAVGLLAWLEYVSWSWVPLMLLLLHASMAGSQPKFVLATLLLAVLLPASALEAGLYWLRNSPSAASHASVTNLARRLYFLDRDVVQYNPECAQYDPELFYTLRPGHCVFRNTEFYTELSVNHLGLRDDEESLVAPEVILLGDSTSMGWGVMDHEEYPNLLEQMTGLRVLNTAVASYATDREMKMLARVDRTGLRWLLLQYCPNDAGENDYYRHPDPSEAPRTETVYNSAVHEQEIERRYYPGRYLTYLLDDSFLDLFHLLGIDWPPAPTLEPFNNFELEVKNLLDVVENVPLDLSGVEIIIYELPEKEFRRDGFAELVAQEVERRAGRRHMDHIVLLDVEKEFEESDFGILDGHINGRGHKKVAEALARILTRTSEYAAR